MGCAQSTPKVQESGKGPQGLGLVPEPGPQTAKVADSDATLEAPDPESQQSRSILVVWRQPPRPLNEEDRWDTLCQMQILDTEPEEVYDNITRLCTQIFRCPMACVTFLDKDRYGNERRGCGKCGKVPSYGCIACLLDMVWFKSVMGLGGNQADRQCSICSWTALAKFPAALVVPDLKDDVRFSNYPVVTEPPHARFYAGSPLVAANGISMGTLCILDTKPRSFTGEDQKLLAQLATMVIKEVERREQLNDAVGRTILQPEEEQQTMAASVAADSQAIMLCDVSDPKWPILFTNNAWETQMGLSRGVACGANFWDLFAPLSARHVQAYTLATEQQRPFQLRVRCTAAASSTTGSAPETVQLQLWSMSGSMRGALQAATAIAIPTTLNNKLVASEDPGRYYWASVIPEDTSRKGEPASRPASSVTGTAAPGVVAGSHNSGSSGGYQPSSGNRGSGGRGSGSGGRGSSSGGRGSGSAGSGGATPMNGAQPSSPGGMIVVAADGGSGAAARDGLPSPSGEGAGAGHGALPVADAPSVSTSFLLLPEPEDAFSGLQLGNLLGRGAYGAVYRGRWNKTLVAVKIVDVADPKQNPHAALEPLLHNRLNHPNIIKLYGISTREVELCSEPVTAGAWLDENEQEATQQQEVWMIMEFCNRGTLSDAIARGALAELGPDGTRVFGTVNMRRLISTMREIASAMSYLHGQNVLHGDLTGNNIMLITDKTQRKGFSCKVADFGLSRLIGEDEQRIKTRTHGTITHMAPEVIMAGTHSRKTDVYSFGMVMLEGYIGECPFQGMHYAQVVQHVTSGQALPIPEDAPHDLKALMQATLAHNPDDRPTFAEIHERLCNMEAALKKADAGKPMQERRPMTVSAPSSALQSAGASAEFSPTIESESAAAFDTIQGVISEAVFMQDAAMAALEEDPTTTGVQSF